MQAVAGNKATVIQSLPAASGDFNPGNAGTIAHTFVDAVEGIYFPGNPGSVEPFGKWRHTVVGNTENKHPVLSVACQRYGFLQTLGELDPVLSRISSLVLVVYPNQQAYHIKSWCGILLFYGIEQIGSGPPTGGNVIRRLQADAPAVEYNGCLLRESFTLGHTGADGVAVAQGQVGFGGRRRWRRHRSIGGSGRHGIAGTVVFDAGRNRCHK